MRAIRPFLRSAAVLGALPLLCSVAFAQTDAPHAPVDLLKPVIANENAVAVHRECYEYLAQERSDRTAGHMWTERIVETEEARLRLLVAVDGKPLSPERAQQETSRLESIAKSPADFLRKEQAQRNDEAHAKHMLELLPTDFIFDNVRLEDGVWHMDYHPNPAVSPSSLEDEVLHGMSGTLAIDAKQYRLIHIDGHLAQPVNLGFGMLASIHAGSHFSSDRRLIDGHWRTVHVVTDIQGKAALFKSIAKNTDTSRADFRYFDHDLSVPEAVEELLRAQVSAN